MSASIWITTSFVGFHRWPEAPAEVQYLASLHRHVFNVRASWRVTHDDRDKEFHIQKQLVENAIQNMLDIHLTNHWSCERWARAILAHVGAACVEVNEDGECGATVEAD